MILADPSFVSLLILLKILCKSDGEVSADHGLSAIKPCRCTALARQSLAPS